jgi:hypothetical protein
VTVTFVDAEGWAVWQTGGPPCGVEATVLDGDGFVLVVVGQDHPSEGDATPLVRR